MNRREFLKLIGLGVGAVVVPKIVIESIPVINKPIENFASDVGGYLIPFEFHEQLLKAFRGEGPLKEWPVRKVKVVDHGR